MIVNKVGKLIVFEGIDNVGKTTLVRAVCNKLLTIVDKVAAIQMPSDGPVGELIRKIFRGEKKVALPVMMTLMHADGIDADARIREYLSQEFVVLCDRHTMISARVYQREHHSIDTVESLCATHQFAPADEVFLLDAPPAFALERGRTREKYKDVIYERDDELYVGRLRNRYLRVVEDWVGSVVLDATRPIDELMDAVIAKIYP
jgi:dTMP kinase